MLSEPPQRNNKAIMPLTGLSEWPFKSISKEVPEGAWMELNCWASKILIHMEMCLISMQLVQDAWENVSVNNIQASWMLATIYRSDNDGRSIVKRTWGELFAHRHNTSSEEGFFPPPVAVWLHTSFTWLHHWTVILLTYTWQRTRASVWDVIFSRECKVLN